MSRTSSMLAIGVAGLAVAAASAAARTGAPATAIVRVVQREAWHEPGSGEARFMVQIDEVLNGWLPASAVLVSAQESRSWFEQLRPGATLHVVLEARSDGCFEVRRARRWARPDGTPHDPFPPPLVIEPKEPKEGLGRAGAMSTNAAYVQEVVELVNQARWDNGQLPPLKQVNELHSSAGTHSYNMADRDFVSHCDLDILTMPGERITAADYYWSPGGGWAENIAAGYSTPAAVMDGTTGWMGSPGHRANILSTNSWELGVGYEYQASDSSNVRVNADSDCVADFLDQGPYQHYWTQNFGKRTNVYPVVIEREAAETTSTTVDLYVYGEGWAQYMSFSNDGVSWSTEEAYVADKQWTLTSSDGEKTVYARVRSGATTYQSSDTIILNAGCAYPDTVSLTDETVTGTQVHNACTLISAGPNFVVDTGGSVSCYAPTVALKNGFSVASGGSFVAGQ